MPRWWQVAGVVTGGLLFLLLISFSLEESVDSHLTNIPVADDASVVEAVRAENKQVEDDIAAETLKNSVDDLYPDEEVVRVLKVIDGDTVKLQDGRTMRYAGIDTPETVRTGTPVECYGVEASNYNKERVTGQEITVTFDKDITDKYGRLLGYVFLDEVMINEELVAAGYAKASYYPPNDRYREELEAAETIAVQTGQGLWGKCE